MRRAVLRNLWAHKVRLILSTLAVTLGVAFVVGTNIFTDTLNKTFDDLFTQTASDVVVEPASEVDEDTQSGSLVVPGHLVTKVEGVDGVAAAEGSVLVNGAQVIGSDGQALASGGAPNFGANWSDNEALTPFRLTDGRGPTAPGEFALDSQTAEAGDLAVGDTVKLTTPGGAIESELVGVFRFGTSGNLAGASIAAFTTEETQELMLDGQNAFTTIEVQIDEGLTQDEVAANVQTALGQEVKVQTGEQAADEASQDIAEALSFINIFLTVFAGIALFVGIFLILNTFSMLVAQRTRELALFRALGASRSQVVGSLLGEALAVGVIGATLGLGFGIVVAVGIQSLFGAIGLEVSGGGFVLEPGTVVVAYVVGILVTVVAAWFPAWRASRIPPVAALRADATLPQRSLKVRAILGIVIFVLGVLALVTGFTVATGGGAASLVGLGAFLVFMGVVVLSPIMSRSVVGVLGAPVKSMAGTTGTLAVENAQRNRRRTAATASALMIGLALVSAISVMAASTTASINGVIDDQFKLDVIVETGDFTPFGTTVGEEIAAVDGVESVSPYRATNAVVDGADHFVSAIDPATIGNAIDLESMNAQFESLKPDEFALDADGVEEDGLNIGDTVEIQFPTGPREMTLASTYEGSIYFVGFIMSLEAFDVAGMKPLDTQLYVNFEDGADVAAVRSDIEAILVDYPRLSMSDQQEYKEAVQDQVNQLLTLIYGLLALAILIAVLGIVNTLALSVIERTREIGLLRAVGMSRGQLRNMVRWESLVIALYGALLGVVVGVGFGVALQRASSSAGIDRLAIPWVNLVVFVVVAAIVGLLAAWWPARRAAKLDVLKAITTE